MLHTPLHQPFPFLLKAIQSLTDAAAPIKTMKMVYGQDSVGPHLLERGEEGDSPAPERRPHQGDGRLAPPVAHGGEHHQVAPLWPPLGAGVYAPKDVVEQLGHQRRPRPHVALLPFIILLRGDLRRDPRVATRERTRGLRSGGAGGGPEGAAPGVHHGSTRKLHIWDRSFRTTIV